MARFRRRRADTHVGTIEAQYGVDLNVRSDMKLRTLLDRRGFNSLTALLSAYRGKRSIPSRDRPVFLSFYHLHGRQKGWVNWLTRELGYSVISSHRIASENEEYVRETLRRRIDQCSVLVCLIGYGTHDRRWVRWEMEEALKLGRGICGIRLHNPRDAAGRKGRPAKLSSLIELLSFPVVVYPKSGERANVIRVIEQAAAVGSRYRIEDIRRARR